MTATTKSLVKYAIALLLLVLILHHAGMEKIVQYLRQVSPLYLLLALVLATLGQIAAALRMRFFFDASGFPLNTRFALVLFYVGAFYNFLLPGGIGGDAYKVILARKRMDMPAKRGIRIMLADRASGLCILLFILFATLYCINFSRSIPYSRPLLISAAGVTLAGYVLFSCWLLKQSAGTMLASLPYSLAVQLLWVAVLVTLWRAIGGEQYLIPYLALYSAASITAMLPVSVGGLGIKEMTYFYGAEQMTRLAGVPVDGNLGVALSLCIFAMGFLTSLPGLLWLEKVTKIRHS